MYNPQRSLELSRPTKPAMAPPAEREHKHPHPYVVGDVGKTKHMNVFQTQEDNLLAVTRLKPNDPCFVLRSDGGYTFAKVLARQNGSEGYLEIQVNNEGSTKTIPMDRCANKYIRTMRLHTPPSSPRQPKMRPQLQRRSSETFSSTCTQRHGLSLKRLSNRSNSFQSGLSDLRFRPAYGRQSSHNASFQSGLDTPQARRRSGRSHSHGSSILAQVPEAEDTQCHASCSMSNELEDILADIDLCSTEGVESDLDVISEPDTEHGLGCASPYEGSQRSSTPKDCVVGNRELFVVDSVKTVALPGEFDNIQFNEASLIKAFSSIVSGRTGVSVS